MSEMEFRITRDWAHWEATFTKFDGKVQEIDGHCVVPLYGPQCGGYVVATVVEIDRVKATEQQQDRDRGFLACFNAYYFSDGEFTKVGEPQIRLHHCCPTQFIRYGLDVAEAQLEHSGAVPSEGDLKRLNELRVRLQTLIEKAADRSGA